MMVNGHFASLQPALDLIEDMNAFISDLQKESDIQDAGMVFSGTREKYNTFGGGLLENLYALEQHVNRAREHLIDISHSQ